MTSFLNRVTTGVTMRPLRVVITGHPGSGKTTLASSAANCLLMPVEEGLGLTGATALPTPKSFDDVIGQLIELAKEDHSFGSIVIDAIDGIEPFIFEDIVANAKPTKSGPINSIAEIGFNKGYVEADAYWVRFFKALDYLLSRKDIDSRRVGCTGESGGGTQTYFLAAVDERVKVVAPAVMLSGHMQGGCVCENAPGLHLRYSNLHYAGLIAPRPMLLLGCTGDWTHHMRERELPAMRDLYGLYKKQDAIDGFYQDEGHNYNQGAREAVYSWMVRWLMQGNRSGAAEKVAEASNPVPERSRLLVFDKPIPPYKGAIRRPKQLFDMWQDLHRKPATSVEVADVLQLQLPDKQDLLIRSQPARHRYRVERGSLHTITYGRFSQDSSVPAGFLPPATKADRTLLLLRQWADRGAWSAFCRQPSPQLRKLMDAGWGVVIPLLFGQQGTSPSDEFQRRSHSYLATTYGKTAHMHQADDILTTTRLAQVELRVQPDSLTLVADANMGLITYAVWSFLQSQTQAGPLVADLGGVDLRAPTTWAKRAYVPLLLGAGGIAGLSQLAGKGTGRLFGVRTVDRPLFPKTLRISPKRASLAQLLAAAGP